MDPNLPQTTMNFTKYPKDVTDLQTQSPTEQPVSPIKTMTVTLKGDHRAYVVTYSEGGSLYEALTSLQAIKKKMRTQKSTEMLVQGTEGIEGYRNLGMPFRCFPENCCLEIPFAQSESEQKIENQEFAGRSKVSSKCVKFYIHAVGKQLRRIVKFKHLHKKGCKLCIYGFKEETIRQALCRDGRLLPFLENGDWKLIENGDTILENTQLVDDLEGRVFEVEVDKRKLTRASMDEHSLSETRNPTPEDEGIVEQHPSLKGESEKINANFKKTVELSKETPLLSKSYETDFGKLTQNSTPITQHRLLAHLANSVGRIEWNKNRRRGSATCFVFSGLYIFTCRHLLRTIAEGDVELHNWASIISQHAKVTFGYENSSRVNNKYFSIDPSFLVSNEELDYGVLRLKENGQVPLGLHLRGASVPRNGLIHIIGHSHGQRKRSDVGVVIPQRLREEEYHKCIQAKKEGCQSEDVFLSKRFQKIANNPNRIIYHSPLSFGSSGSPVFNSSGALVAVHLGSIYRNRESAIGYGVPLKSILLHIYQTEAGKDWFKELKTVADIDWPGEDVEMVTKTQQDDSSPPEMSVNSTVKKMKATLKETMEISKQITLLSKSYETGFGKLTQNPTPITCHRRLARRANSVGCLEWDNNGIRGSATCFVLTGWFICTCRQVLKRMVGEGVELHNWISIISQHARVTFDYENSFKGKNRYFSIDPWFFVSNEELDYAILRLKVDGQVPLGLCEEFDSVPLNGLIYMIGHPNGEIKCSNAGVVIPQSQREEEGRKCVQARKAEGCQSDEMSTSKYFQKIANNPDVITYHTSLFSGSSGSPVFDSSGALVAMHLGCIEQKEALAIGFGVSLKSIIFDICFFILFYLVLSCFIFLIFHFISVLHTM